MKVIEETCSHVANTLDYPSLKNKQKSVLTNYILGNDVFAMLPTGFGKSLCYACLPCVFDHLLGTTNSIVKLKLYCEAKSDKMHNIDVMMKRKLIYNYIQLV